MALPFIKFVGNQFVLDPQAEKFLTQLGNERLGVISVVGKYRTGKSFFVNRVLLNKSNAFQVGPTINPCTKGLWLWNQVLHTQNAEYPDMKTIVIDTEGVGGMDENVNHDTRIFLFSLLLSSYFIYNSVGSIDENALNTISLIVNLAKEIQGANHHDFFPQFLWIVRDFALQLVDSQGNQIQSKDYLENALEQQKGLSDSVEQKNRIRRMIKHFFKDRDCTTMIRPVEKEEDLQRLDNIADKDLRSEFVNQINQVRSKIFRRIKPKTLHGAFLTGPQLLNLAKAYIETVNGGKVPNVESAWGYVLKAEGEKALRDCIFIAEKEIEQLKSKAIPWDKLALIKTQIYEQIKKEFKGKAVGSEEDLRIYYEKLGELFEDKFNEFKQNNKRNLKGHYQKIISPYVDAILDKLKNEEYNNYYELQTEMFKLRDKFEKDVGRNQKTSSFFDEVSLSIYQSAAEKLSRKAAQQGNVENKQLQNKLQNVERELDKCQRQAETDKQRFIDKISSLEKDQLNISVNETQSKEKLDRLKNELQQNIKLREELAQQNQQLEQQNQISQQKFNQTIDKIRNENIMNQNQLEKQLALLQQENSFLQREQNMTLDKIQQSESENKKLRQELNQLKALNETLQQRCNTLDVGRAQEIQKLQLEFEKKVQELTNDIDSKKQNLRMQSEWMVEKSYLENQVNFLKSQLDENKRLHDALLIALQQNGGQNDYQESQIELMETNRNLSAAMDKIEMRCKMQEEKIEKLKKFKRMIKNSSNLQCLHCQKSLPSSTFGQHLNICIEQVSQIQASRNSTMLINLQTQIDLSQLQISINQTMVRETPDNKPYTEYMIRVQYGTKKWTVSRRYKNFCELHQNINSQYPGVKLPDSSQAIINTADIGNVFNAKRPTVIEERRKALQQYIRDLAKIDVIRNSLSYRKFLELDQENGQNESRNTSQCKINMGSPTSFDQQQSSRDYGRESISSQTKHLWKQTVPLNQLGPSTSRSIAKDQNQTQKENQPQIPYKVDRKLLPQSPQSFLKAFQKQQENSKIYRMHHQQHSLLELSESQIP